MFLFFLLFEWKYFRINERFNYKKCVKVVIIFYEDNMIF